MFTSHSFSLPFAWRVSVLSRTEGFIFYTSTTPHGTHRPLSQPRASHSPWCNLGGWGGGSLYRHPPPPQRCSPLFRLLMSGVKISVVGSVNGGPCTEGMSLYSEVCTKGEGGSLYSEICTKGGGGLCTVASVQEASGKSVMQMTYLVESTDESSLSGIMWMLLESGITIFIEPSGWVNSVTGPILLVTLQTSWNTSLRTLFIYLMSTNYGIESRLLICKLYYKWINYNEITYLMLSDFIIAFFLLCLFQIIGWLLRKPKSCLYFSLIKIFIFVLFF